MKKITLKVGALAVTGVLALTGCASGNPQVAAYVDDTQISQAQVDAMSTVVVNTGTATTGAAARTLVVQVLIVNQVARVAAASRGFSVTDAERQQVLAANAGLAKLAQDPVTKDFVNDYITAYELTQTDAGRNAFNDQFAKTTIRVNPRFGVWDPKQDGFVDGSTGSISSIAPIKQE